MHFGPDIVCGPSSLKSEQHSLWIRSATWTERCLPASRPPHQQASMRRAKRPLEGGVQGPPPAAGPPPPAPPSPTIRLETCWSLSRTHVAGALTSDPARCAIREPRDLGFEFLQPAIHLFRPSPAGTGPRLSMPTRGSSSTAGSEATAAYPWTGLSHLPSRPPTWSSSPVPSSFQTLKPSLHSILSDANSGPPFYPHAPVPRSRGSCTGRESRLGSSFLALLKDLYVRRVLSNSYKLLSFKKYSAVNHCFSVLHKTETMFQNINS